MDIPDIEAIRKQTDKLIKEALQGFRGDLTSLEQEVKKSVEEFLNDGTNAHLFRPGDPAARPDFVVEDASTEEDIRQGRVRVSVRVPAPPEYVIEVPATIDDREGNQIDVVNLLREEGIEVEEN